MRCKILSFTFLHAAVPVILIALLAFTVLGAAAAQVTVSKPTEINGVSADEQVPCPMQLDVQLGPSAKRHSLADVKVGGAWSSDETSKFVCHTERVARVYVSKKKEWGSILYLLVSATIKSEQWRQDVDVTLSLLSPTGKVLCSKSWEDLTVGKDRAISKITWVTMASETKSVEFECKVDGARFAAMFSGEQNPAVRVVLKPKIDPEDKSGDR
jgi:hypothetical protein